MFRIDTDIPPPVPPRAPRKRAWPLDALEIGHSLFAQGATKKEAQSQVHRFRLETDPSWSFVIREEPGGVRVWRVA